LKKITVASTVKLSDGTPDSKKVSVQVRNEGNHSESFAVYVDIVPPGGSSNPYNCIPMGRIINTVVTLAPGEQTVVNTNRTFNCTNVAGALNQTYTINAAVDVHADDTAACPFSQIQGMTCFNALADDDDDDTDNRASTNGFAVR
jgi:hypothetical protein